MSTHATAKQRRLIARLATEQGIEAPAVTTIAEASAAIDELKRRANSVDGLLAQITVLADERDLRYLDTGAAAYYGNRSAGEIIRARAAADARADAMTAEQVEGIRLMLAAFVEHVDTSTWDGRHSVTITHRALLSCPRLRDEVQA